MIQKDLGEKIEKRYESKVYGIDFRVNDKRKGIWFLSDSTRREEKRITHPWSSGTPPRSCVGACSCRPAWLCRWDSRTCVTRARRRPTSKSPPARARSAPGWHLEEKRGNEKSSRIHFHPNSSTNDTNNKNIWLVIDLIRVDIRFSNVLVLQLELSRVTQVINFERLSKSSYEESN